MAGFPCFFPFPFLLALVVPLFLRCHLNLGCYVPSGVERGYVSGVCLFVDIAITLRCNTTVCIIYWPRLGVVQVAHPATFLKENEVCKDRATVSPKHL